ncbi:MAG: uracil-DNA glycosylase [Ignavibacteriaceae bacterium]
MNKEIKEQIIQSLIDQKEIFGDELFEENILNSEKNSTRKTKIKKDEKNIEVSKDLFVERENWEKAKTLDELERLINTCTKCPLHKNRNKFVFGKGNPNADVMVVGEGPGAEEDKQGEPFVGRAGKLLTDILNAIKFSREEVYIANVVKSRPPGNRTPNAEEMEACLPYLKKQIALIKPKLILCLGLTAAQGVLKKKDSLTKMRGQVFDFEGTKVMVTYHPAALLRNPNWKRPAWEDVQQFRKLYDEIK